MLRSQAARWAADNFSKLTDPEPSIPDALNDRAADNWRPLLAIADLAGGAWPGKAREAACLLSGEGHDTSVNVELLARHPRRPLATWMSSALPTWWTSWSPIRSALGRNGAVASRSPRSSSPGSWRPSASPRRPCIGPAGRTQRATSESILRGYGRSTVLVKTLLRAQKCLPKRPSVQMPMEWALLAIFEASKKEVRTDRKTPTYPTAMRVWTLGRIESPKWWEGVF